MRRSIAILLFLFLPLESRSAVEMTSGPAKAKVGDLAELEIPKGYRWVDKAHISEFMKSLHNIPRDSELGALIGDKKGGEQWFALFEFEDTGYIKDAASEKLDADELIKSINEGNEQANEERKKQGYGAIEVVGWGKAPFYNPDTQRLEWSVLAKSGNSEIINYKSRILGRKGVMSVVLVCDAAALDKVLPDFQQRLEHYSYLNGEKYAQWKQGDKVAAFGLAALVLGGVAAKTGFLAKFAKVIWKFILIGIAAIGGAIKKIKAWFSGKKEKPEGHAPQNPVDSAASANGPDETRT